MDFHIFNNLVQASNFYTENIEFSWTKSVINTNIINEKKKTKKNCDCISVLKCNFIFN